MEFLMVKCIVNYIYIYIVVYIYVYILRIICVVLMVKNICVNIG